MLHLRKLTLAFLTILSYLSYISSSQKAILMSSSLGYYNIRQANNIVKIYQHFRKNGFRDEDILLLISQVQTCCEKNHLFGSLSFYDGDYGNIFKDVEVDYYQSEMTVQSVAHVLMGYHNKYTLNKKKLSLNRNQPLFIYITGHGGDTYFKIRQREALIDQQFSAIFKTLSLKDIVSKIAIFSDSCSAITPFQTVKIPKFLALGSSSFGEKSQSHGYDAQLNQPKTDDFSFYFDEILSQKINVKGLSSLDNWTFKDIHKYMDHTKLKVNSKLISNKLPKNQKISNFIVKKSPQIVYKKIKRINIDDFLNS